MHKKECGKQPWLVKDPSLGQEMAVARRVFVRNAESDIEVGRRIEEFLSRMKALAWARDHARVVAARQEFVWAYSHLRAFHEIGLQGVTSPKILDGASHDACEVWHLLGHAYIGLQEHEKARQALETRLAFCEERNLNKLLGAAHEDLGCLEAACHAAPKAEECFQRAKTLHHACGSKHGVRSAVSHLSELFEGRCRHRMTLDSHQEMLVLDEELWSEASDEGGDGSEQAQQMLSKRIGSTVKVGSTLVHLLQHEEALAVFESSRGLIRSLKDPNHYNKQVLLNMGTAATCLGRAEHAIELWQSLLEMAEAANDAGVMAGALKCLGTRQIARGNLGKATEYLERALALTGGDTDDASVFYNLAMAQIGSGLLEQGVENFRVCTRKAQHEPGAMPADSMELYQLRLMQAMYKAHKAGGTPSLSSVVEQADHRQSTGSSSLSPRHLRAPCASRARTIMLPCS